MNTWRQCGLRHVEALFPRTVNRGTIAAAICRFADAPSVDKALTSPHSAAVMADIENFTDARPVRYRTVPP